MDGANLVPGSGYDQAMSDLSSAKSTLESQAKKTAGDIEGITKKTEALQPPELTLPPKPQTKQTSPITAFGSPATMLAILGGLLTRRPLVTALNGAAGVIKAYKQQDAERAKQAFEQWKVESENAVKMADFKMQTYKAIIDKNAADISAKQAELSAAAHAFQDDLMVAQLQQNGWEAGKRLALEQARLTLDMKKGQADLAKSGAEIAALHELTASPEYKAASPQQKLQMIRGNLGNETFDKMKVQIVQNLTAKNVKAGMPPEQAQLKAMRDVETATAKGGAGQYGKPTEIEYKDKSGKTTQAQAVYDSANAQWLTASGRQPIDGTDIKQVKTDMAGGGRSQLMMGRVLGAAKDTVTDLENIAALPVSSSSGWLSTARGGNGIFTTTRAALANEITPQDIQDYNAQKTGLGMSLARLQAGGLQINEQSIREFDQLGLQQGDTVATKLRKMALMRQYTDNILDVVDALPMTTDKERDEIKGMKDRLSKSIPYGVADINALERATNPETTMRDAMKERGLGGPAIGTVEDGFRFKGGDPSDPKNWEKVKP